MPKMIEVNVATGKQIEREMTAEEIAAIPANAEQSTPSLENGTISQEYGETLQSWATASGDDR